ncbi:MAG: hypothetical protein IJP68_08735, partial [Selenomonadaceae bacterium]|nr:hypothetical protein [Selenomonadaceae bacterium]
HGVDDTRSAIISLASDANLMEQAIAETKHWADYPTVTSGNVKLNAPCYAGGYTLLRYMGKQAADSYVKLFTGTNAADNFETRNDFITIGSAGGNDTIKSDGNKNSLNGGAGADSIIIGGESTTVEGGQDNDEISLTSASKNTLMLYRVGDGNDTIYNSKSTDTLSIDGGAAYAETAINGTTFLGVGDASIALTGERPKIVQSNVEGAAITLNNSFSNTLITGSDDADSIVNTGFSVTINGGSGNDTIKNGSYEDGAVFNGGNSVSIFAGDGDNYIYGKEDQFVTIVAGNGNDSAHSYKGENNSIDLAGGNNYFNGYYAKGISVSCGAQDDTLCAWGGDNLYYSAGDGNNYVSLKDVTNSTFACGVGNDSVYISGSANSVDVGTGNNFVSLGSSSKNDTVMCAAGNSTIINIDGSQNVYYCDFDGNAANISLVGANSGDTIFIAGYTAFETLNNGTELVVKSGNGILRAINAVDKNITVRNCGDPPAPDTLTSEEPPSSKTLIT